MGEDNIQAATENAQDTLEVRCVESTGWCPPRDYVNSCNPIRYILDNQEVIATIACLDSGKTKIDASLGEILVTVEKLKWTIQHGEKSLRPDRRPTNFLMMYKDNKVIWEPLGVIAACVSWKYVLVLVRNILGTCSDH